LRSFLRFRGYWDEWKKLSEWVYTIALMLQDWRSAGWRAYDIAFIHWNRAETNDAALWATRMSDAMEQGGNRRDRAIATRLCGLVSEQRGDLKEAERLYLQALTVAREFGEESDAASILNDLGEICKLRRELDSADSYYRQAFDIAEKISDKEAQAIYAGNLGLVLLARNQLADARHWYELQLDITRQLEKPDLIAQAQIGLARVLEKGGRYKDALPLAEEALRTRIALRHQGLEGTRELVARLRAKVGEVAQQGA
jgi:tetratricopeptide (TPR) repeat protein